MYTGDAVEILIIKSMGIEREDSIGSSKFSCLASYISLSLCFPLLSLVTTTAAFVAVLPTV